MKISFYRKTVTLILILFISGCSWFGKDEPEYLDSIEVAPLEIPEGLDDPAGVMSVVISEPNMRKPAGDELEPLPPKVVRTEHNRNSNANMIWSADGVYLMVRDTPENVAKRLEVAIENSGVTALGKNDTGAYRFQYDQPKSKDEGFFSRMAFWRKKATDYSGTYTTSLKADGEVTRVYLLQDNGEASETPASEHILGVLMGILE